MYLGICNIKPEKFKLAEGFADYTKMLLEYKEAQDYFA